MLAQQLSFRFANPRIIRLSGKDHLQFDIQVKGYPGTTYLWAGQVKLVFNNTAIDSDPEHWIVATSGLFNGNNSKDHAKYAVSQHIADSSPNKTFIITLKGDNSVKGNGPNTTDFANIPTAWTSLLTVSARLQITSGEALAGIDFQESGMNGFQQFISDPKTFPSYINPNLFDSRDFLSDYMARFYSTAYGWSQVGSGTNNVQYLNWAAYVSTTVWEDAAQLTQADNTLAVAKNLVLKNNATLTIPTHKWLTVSGVFLNTGSASNLVIKSDGSLIANASGLSATVERSMSGGAWHLISAPVSGQTVASFLLNSNNNLKTNPANSNEYYFADFNEGPNGWNSDFLSGEGSSFSAGSGYKIQRNTDGVVTFTGLIVNSLSKPVVRIGDGWNLIGNPFSSSMKVCAGADAVNNFLKVNASQLDPSFGAVYVWIEGLGYNAISNAGFVGAFYPTISENWISVGQGFFVRSKTGGGSIRFTPAMQAHNSSVSFKSTSPSWPGIRLIANAKDVINSTVITFYRYMTTGLDPTFDAGLFRSNPEFEFYTRMIEDDEVDYSLQCLPDQENSNLIIPLGIDYPAGGEVIFSAELVNLPDSYKPVLEDRQTGITTDLSMASATYKATIAAGSKGPGRFYLHTRYQGSGIQAETTPDLLIYTVDQEIHIVGTISVPTTATLYDSSGKRAGNYPLRSSSVNVIRPSGTKPGAYFLVLQDGKNRIFRKLIVN